MKQMHLLFSHTLTPEQIADATASFGVERFVELPDELQSLWSDVPPHLNRIEEYLAPLSRYLNREVKPNDVVLVQGEFGATCLMVQMIKKLGAIAIYSTTERKMVEIHEGSRVVKRSIFHHVRFRQYS